MGRRLVAFGLPLLIAVPAAVSLRAVHGGPEPGRLQRRGGSRWRSTPPTATPVCRLFLDGEAWNQVELPRPARATPSSTSTSRGRAEELRAHRTVLRKQRAPIRRVPAGAVQGAVPRRHATRFRGTTIDGAPMAGTATAHPRLPRRPPRSSRPLPAPRVAARPGRGRSGPRSPRQRASTSPATRFSWSRRSPCCGCSAPISGDGDTRCRSPPSSSSRAPSTRSRSSPSRPAATKRLTELTFRSR